MIDILSHACADEALLEPALGTFDFPFGLGGEGLSNFHLAVENFRRSGQEVLADERILGTDDFVERVLGEADQKARRLFSSRLRDKEVQQFMEERCNKVGISLEELQMGSRRGMIPGIRSDLAWKLAREWGIPLAEIGRRLGVSTSAISQILGRRKVT